MVTPRWGTGRRLRVRAAVLGAGVALLGTSPAHADFAPFGGSPLATGGNGALGLEVLDVNGDSELDAVVTNQGSGTVSVLLGAGDGTFAAAPSSPFASVTSPVKVVAGQFGDSASPDLVVLNASSADLRVFRGNGDGTFTQTVSTISAGPGAQPLGLAAADIDGDGQLDLAIGNTGANPGAGVNDVVTVLKGDGAFGFTPMAGSPVAVGDGPGFVALDDVNGDSSPDLLVANNTTHDVRIYINNGSGAFSEAPSSPIVVVHAPGAVVTGDLDEDGNQDLVISDPIGDAVYAVLGDGAGHFAAAPGSPIPLQDDPSGLAAADFDGDGHLDVATANLHTIGVANNNVQTLFGAGDGHLAAGFGTPFASGSADARLIRAADLDGDSRPDLVVSNRNNLAAGSIGVLRNTFAPVIALAPASLPLTVQTGKTGSQSLTVTNTGNSPLHVASISGLTPPYALVDPSHCATATIAPNGTCVFSASFSPTQAGDTQRTVTVASDAGPATATVSGHASTPNLSLQGTAVTLGAEVGTTATANVTITNSGDAPLKVTTLAVAPAGKGWSYTDPTSCASSPIPAGVTCTVDVAYAPTVAGTDDAALQVTSDGGTGSVPLLGTATAKATTTAPAPPPATQLPPAPEAVIADPGVVTPGEFVVFDGSASTGDGIRYEWDLNSDGTYDTVLGERALAARRFLRNGDFPVTLRVTDAEGRQATATRTIVAAYPASATPKLPETVKVGQTFTIDLNAVTDKRDDVAYYTYDFGDNSGPSRTVIGNYEIQGVFASKSDRVTHRYAASGEYYVTFTAHTRSGRARAFTTAIRALGSSRRARAALAPQTSSTVTYSKPAFADAASKVPALHVDYTAPVIQGEQMFFEFSGGFDDTATGTRPELAPAKSIPGGIASKVGTPSANGPQINGVQASAVGRAATRGAQTRVGDQVEVYLKAGTTTWRLDGKPVVSEDPPNGRNDLTLTIPSAGPHKLTVTYTADAKHGGASRSQDFTIYVAEKVCDKLKVGAYTAKLLKAQVSSGFGCMISDETGHLFRPELLSATLNINGIKFLLTEDTVVDRDTGVLLGKAPAALQVSPPGAVKIARSQVQLRASASDSAFVDQPDLNLNLLGSGQQVNGLEVRSMNVALSRHSARTHYTLRLPGPFGPDPDRSPGKKVQAGQDQQVDFTTTDQTATMRATAHAAEFGNCAPAGPGNPDSCIQLSPFRMHINSIPLGGVTASDIDLAYEDACGAGGTCHEHPESFYLHGGGVVSVPALGDFKAPDLETNEPDGDVVGPSGFGIWNKGFRGGFAFNGTIPIGPVSLNRIYAGIETNPLYFRGSMDLTFPSSLPIVKGSLCVQVQEVRYLELVVYCPDTKIGGNLGTGTDVASPNKLSYSRAELLRLAKITRTAAWSDTRSEAARRAQPKQEQLLALANYYTELLLGGGSPWQKKSYFAPMDELSFFAAGHATLLGLVDADIYLRYLHAADGKTQSLGLGAFFDVDLGVASIDGGFEGYVGFITVNGKRKNVFQVFGRLRGCIGLCISLEALVNQQWIAGCGTFIVSAGFAYDLVHHKGTAFTGCDLRNSKYYIPPPGTRSATRLGALRAFDPGVKPPDVGSLDEARAVPRAGTTTPPPAYARTTAMPIIVNPSTAATGGGFTINGHRASSAAQPLDVELTSPSGARYRATLGGETVTQDNARYECKVAGGRCSASGYGAWFVGTAGQPPAQPVAAKTRARRLRAGTATPQQVQSGAIPIQPGGARVTATNLDLASLTPSTFIAFGKKPEKGTWTVTPLNGGTITGVSYSDAEQQNQAHATLDKNGNVTFDAALGANEQAVVYEVDPKTGLMKQVAVTDGKATCGGSGQAKCTRATAAAAGGSVASAALSRKRQRVKVPFTPVPGPAGKRTLYMQISKDGLPEYSIPLTSYNVKAYQPPVATKVRAMWAKGDTLSVSWRLAKLARQYRINVTLDDGRDLVLTAGPKTNHVSLPGVNRYRKATVTVSAIDPTGHVTRSAPARVKAQARLNKTYRVVARYTRGKA